MTSLFCIKIKTKTKKSLVNIIKSIKIKTIVKTKKQKSNQKMLQTEKKRPARMNQDDYYNLYDKNEKKKKYNKINSLNLLKIAASHENLTSNRSKLLFKQHRSQNGYNFIGMNQLMELTSNDSQSFSGQELTIEQTTQQQQREMLISMNESSVSSMSEASKSEFEEEEDNITAISYKRDQCTQNKTNETVIKFIENESLHLEPMTSLQQRFLALKEHLYQKQINSINNNNNNFTNLSDSQIVNINIKQKIEQFEQMKYFSSAPPHSTRSTPNDFYENNQIVSSLFNQKVKELKNIFETNIN
jgi:hypothetical protein